MLTSYSVLSVFKYFKLILIKLPNLSMGYLFEVCVDSVESAVAANEGGANRLELCSALSIGGLTPTLGLLQTIKSLVKIPVFVMIRPRPGHFVYSDQEIEVMKRDILSLKEGGADGFVFGCLNPDGSINSAQCSTLLSLISPLPSTFHRAFDYTNNPFSSLQTIISLGFSRLLTSGQKESAIEGIELIAKLVEEGGGKIEIMPGAGITPQNALEVIRLGGVREIHASCKTLVNSNMSNSSGSGLKDDSSLFVTDSSTVMKIINLLKTGH